MTETITLHSDGMGDATEADFDAWAAYVTEHISGRTEIPDIVVEQARFGEGGEDVSQWSENAETLRDALIELWEEFCGAGWPRS